MALTPAEYYAKAQQIDDELAQLKRDIAALPDERYLTFVTAGAAQILAGYVGADTNGLPVDGEYTPTPTVTSVATSKWGKSGASDRGILTIPFGVDADIYVAGGILNCTSGSAGAQEQFSYLYIPKKGIHVAEVYCKYSGTTYSKSFNTSAYTATITLLNQITGITAIESGYAYAIKFN